MKYEKIIFLDIDGVISTIREWNMTNLAKTYITKYNIYPFNPKCIITLNEILDEINPSIVMSSDWRNFFNLTELADIFQINGVISSPITTTENLSNIYSNKDLGYIRAKEIQKFLDENKVDKFVVIDMNEYFANNFIHCTSEFEGIKKSGLKDKIIKILS